MNPYQIISCGPHARAHVQILPKPFLCFFFSQRFDIKPTRPNGFISRNFIFSSRALLRIHKTTNAFQHSCSRKPRGPFARACRTCPLHESPSNDTMPATGARACRNHSISTPSRATAFVEMCYSAPLSNGSHGLMSFASQVAAG